MSDDPVDVELQQIAGSRKLASELRRNLEKLREGVGGPDLAEMARDVLEGRITLRDVTRSSAYAEPLTAGMERFYEAQAELSEEERATLVEEATERFSDDPS